MQQLVVHHGRFTLAFHKCLLTGLPMDQRRTAVAHDLSNTDASTSNGQEEGKRRRQRLCMGKLDAFVRLFDVEFESDVLRQLRAAEVGVIEILCPSVL